MKRITVDIVLLPDQPMTDRAIMLSQEQAHRAGNYKILLNDKNCLPHISLAMGAMDTNNFPEINKILAAISKKFRPLQLQADLYQGLTIPSREIVSEYSVAKTQEIRDIHVEVMRRLEPYLSYDNLSTDMVFSPPQVEEVTLSWIQDYATKSSYDRFRPHITTGFGQLDDVPTPVDFTAPTLALFQLGNYCTCRNLLCQHKLKTNG